MFADVRPLRVPADWPAGASIACDSILLILIAPRRPQFLNPLNFKWSFLRPPRFVPPLAPVSSPRPMIFGSILPVLTYKTFDEALVKISATPHPLAAFIFSRDMAAIDRFVGELSVSRWHTRWRCGRRERWRSNGRWRQHCRATGRHRQPRSHLPFRGCLSASEGAA